MIIVYGLYLCSQMVKEESEEEAAPSSLPLNTSEEVSAPLLPSEPSQTFTLPSVTECLAPQLTSEHLQFSVVSERWLVVSRSRFDIEDSEPYRVFEFLINIHSGQYLSR